MPENNKVDPALLKYWQDAGFPQYTPREDTIIEIKSKEPLKTQKEASKEKSRYFDTFRGALDRLESSWNNGTDPIKASLDSGLATFIPGLQIGQMAYDIHKGYNHLTSNDGYKKTINSFKLGDYGKGTLSLLGDVLDLTSLIPSINNTKLNGQERLRKSMYRNISPFGYGNLFPGDTPKKQQIKKFLTDTFSVKHLDTNSIPKWITNLQRNKEAQNKPLGPAKLNTNTMLEFRDQAYRKALKLPERKETIKIYKNNPDGTVSYDIDAINKIREQLGSPSTPSASVFKADKFGRVGDYITMNGGYVNKVETPEGIFMIDKWDLHPFEDGRSISPWLSNHFPIIRKLNVSKLLGMDEFTLKHKVQ